MTVSSVIFDWGGTLTPWHSVNPGEAWIAAVGEGELASRLAAAENEIWARTHSEHRSGSLAEILDAAGVAETEAPLAALSRWWEPHTLIDPAVPALFAALHDRGIRIGVLSNTLWSRAEHERIFARDGVLELIDGAVYSSEIPWTKPHPDAFRAALDAVGVSEAGDAVFVGDRPYDDIWGAKQVGMRAVLVPNSDIPAIQRGPVQGEPDAVVSDLADLLAVVDAWR